MLVTPTTQAQDEPTVQILTSPPSPVSNPTSALPSPIIVPPTPEQQHEPQPSTSTAASQAPPQPRQSQSTFRHVGPASTAGGRPYTHSPLRPAHRGTAFPAGPSAAPGTGNMTVFRTLSSSTGNTPAVLSPSPSPHALSPRIFTLSQQTRTSSPLASSNVSAPVNNGSLPVVPVPIGQRGGITTPIAPSSRLTNPAPPTPAGAASPSSSSHTMEAPPQPPSKGPTPSPTPSTSQKVLPQTPPSRPVSLPRHPGHTPTHSNTLLVQLPPSTPTSRSETPVPTPPPRASGSAPYRAGFQPKGMYRSHTDEFLESRARNRESGRVEQRRLERRLDKVCSNRHTRASFFSSISFVAILIYFYFYFYIFIISFFALIHSLY